MTPIPALLAVFAAALLGTGFTHTTATKPMLSAQPRSRGAASALSGGNNRATTLLLNASPYRAIFHPYRPQVQDHIGATTILTQGGTSSMGMPTLRMATAANSLRT